MIAGGIFPKIKIWHWRRDGVVHRLNGGANRKAPVQPVNNAGEAIQPSSPASSGGVSPPVQANGITPKPESGRASFSEEICTAAKNSYPS